LHDAVQLGKIFDLARETRFGRKAWDLVIVDAPATGHGLSLLASARNMMALTRGGPLYEGSKLVSDVVDDPAQSGVVLVTLPEEMPVNETLELYDKLGDAQQRVRLQVLNQVAPSPFPPEVDWSTARDRLLQTGIDGVAATVRLADAWLQRCGQQRDAARRLQERIPSPLVELPRERNEPDLATLRAHGVRLGAALEGAA
jgi:anion-transporting  ArsA/GET3 family ATPase